jgi:hypothetical protein
MCSVGLTTDTDTGLSSGTTNGDLSSNGFSPDSSSSSSTNDSGDATEFFFGDRFIGTWLKSNKIVHVLTPLDGGQFADSQLRRN